MSLKDIASLGKMLAQFLVLFQGCFSRPAGRFLLAVYVRGLLSDIHRKNAEAIARDQNVGSMRNDISRKNGAMTRRVEKKHTY